LRVNAEYLERIMGLAAEALVESGRLLPLSRGLVQIRRGHEALGRRFEDLVPRLERSAPDERMPQAIRELRGLLRQASERLLEQEILAGQLEQRLTQLTGDIYDEATLSRMRAFADGIAGLPRMARDLARELGKEVRLEVTGTATQVDRDVLESLQAPLNHLLRNAIDHAIEPPAERVAAGKPPAGSIWVDARHHAGLLRITVRDDGRGIDTQRLRAELVRRKLVTEALGSELSDAELFEFLFLPSFSLTREVTEISGRGVGLDIVLSTLQRMRGTIRIHSELGQGASFELQLPLTLSVLRGLVVEVMEQVYVFPLVRVERVLSVATTTLQSLEGREYCEHDGAAIGLVTARQILRFPADPIPRDRLSLVLLGERSTRYGVVVDRLRTVAEVVVQPIDPALGKLRNIAAATLLASGEPALILDVDDLIRSIDGLISAGRLSRARPLVAALREQKRILVVDDSFTVREVERKLLENRGYRVDVAVDGMDGWNALRGGAYDLIVTDVDMPRMNGIELVAMIRKDPLLRSLPVMIVSYKDREEDRQRGLAVGADYYLAKSSFQDESLLDVVKELIGAA
jgi:two-component system sensor histidine kinase and response regulator WspE